MVMLFYFCFDLYPLSDDGYLAEAPHGTAKGACIRCATGGLLFFPIRLVCQTS